MPRLTFTATGRLSFSAVARMKLSASTWLFEYPMLGGSPGSVIDADEKGAVDSADILGKREVWKRSYEPRTLVL